MVLGLLSGEAGPVERGVAQELGLGAETADAETRARRPLPLPTLRVWLETRPWLIDTLGAFLISRLVFYLSAAVALAAIPEYHHGLYQPWHTGAPALIDASWRWDGGWYLTLIQHGYQLGAGQSDVTFFPLYPLLVRATLIPFSLRWLYLTGVLVNHVAFLLALVAIWFYAEAAGGRGVARRTLYFLAIFPTSLFFSAGYSEATFLLATALCLLALQRHRFALAGAAGSLAGLARPFGILLVLPFLVALWRYRRNRGALTRGIGALLLLPCGLLALTAYFWWRFGDPLVFARVQGAWNHTPALPWDSLLLALRQVAAGGNSSYYVMDVVNTAAALLALALGAALLQREPGAGLYALATVLLPLTAPTIGNPSMNLARYVVVLFPIFVELARRASGRVSVATVTALFLPAGILLTLLFTRWYWVT